MKNHGLLRLGRVRPGQGPSNSQGLPPGVWCLHTLSTVPYVELTGGSAGRLLTWGECVEIDTPANVLNGSFHAGEIVLAPCHNGVAALRPATVLVPLEWVVDPSSPADRVSSRVDVRQAARAYLVQPGAQFNVGDAWTVEQFAVRPTAGAPGGPELGPVVYPIQPLGATTGQINLAPGAVQEPTLDFRPGAFWDWLRLRASAQVVGTFQQHVLLNYY